MKSESAKTLELRRIAAENNGILRAEDVVAAARVRTSPLHSSFEWDDGAAAEQYRLWQARQLIRTTVRLMDVNGDDKVPVRVFVSLTTDRQPGDDGEDDRSECGYREVVKVLSQAELRKQMLDDALAELAVFERKYHILKELAEVFAAAQRARNRRR